MTLVVKKFLEVAGAVFSDLVLFSSFLPLVVELLSLPRNTPFKKANEMAPFKLVEMPSVSHRFLSHAPPLTLNLFR